MIDEVVAVQEPSGYLNTYYVDDRKPERMLTKTQTTGHELYNIGHMLQGAIAYYRATGDRKLLDAGIRFVDDFLMPNYGPAPKTADRFRPSGDRTGTDRAVPHHRGQASAGSGRLHPSRRRADEAGRAAHHLHVQRNSVYRAGPSWKATRCARCMPAAARPTTTWRPATRRIGRR